MIFDKNHPAPFDPERTAVSAQLFGRASTVWSAFAVYTNPIRTLRALEQMNKFKALDDAALLDAGLSQEDVERATLRDFLQKR